MKKIRFSLPVLATLLVVAPAFAQRQMEQLGRGVVAVRSSSTQVFVGWRLLGTDPANTGFRLYRVASGVTNVLNGGNVLTTATSFVDTPANLAVANTYFVQPVINGVTQANSASYTLPANSPTQQYLSIPLAPPPDGSNPSGPYTYTANDCSVADLDGDGEYEIVLKWDPSNAKDNSQSGFTGNVFLDGYKLNGTRLWRIDLGQNIRAGAHYTQYNFSAGKFSFSGTGGTPNWSYDVLTSTNLTLPVSVWSQVASGQFDAAGNFSAILPVTTSAQQFYLLRVH